MKLKYTSSELGEISKWLYENVGPYRNGWFMLPGFYVVIDDELLAFAYVLRWGQRDDS
jgi:hypothetical protein